MAEKAPDVAAKLDLLRGDLFNIQAANQNIVVKWLSRAHANDPALASLGFGVHTLCIARAKDVTFEDGVFVARTQGPSASAVAKIPLDDILDIKVCGEGPITDEEVRAFVGQDRAGPAKAS